MIGDFFVGYFGALADFWGTTMRLGLPHLILLILILMWLRRGRCGKWRGKSCCWSWGCGSGGWDGDHDDSPPCGCTCGACRWQPADAADEPAAEAHDEDGDS